MRARRLVAAIALMLLAAALPAVAGPTLLFNADDGRVLYAEDIDDHWHPASLTKMMTAYVVFGAVKAGKLRLDQSISCSETAFQQPPSKLGLAVGGTISVDQALQVLIVKSANDVAVMLAEAVSGDQAAFVAEMNATAKRLGMTRTHFSNPNGLPAPDQVTTARDLAKLARAISRDYPSYAAYWAMPAVRLGNLYMRTHNGLLKTLEGADGMKTGFICDSGFNVVGSATRDGTKMVAVVLGEKSSAERTLRAASLLEHGFQNSGWKQIFNSTTIDNMPVAEARSAISVRDDVTSWDCGRQKRLAARQAKAKAKAEARAKAKSEAKEAAAGKAGADAAKKPPAPQKPAETQSAAAKATATAKPKAKEASKAQPAGAAAKAPATAAAGDKPASNKSAVAATGSTSAPPAPTASKPAAPAAVSAGAALPDSMKPTAPAKPAAAFADGAQ
jgi:D-alanyl-D-alanine carboxypeptidase